MSDRKIPRNKVEDIIIQEWVKNFQMEAERQLNQFTDDELKEELSSLGLVSCEIGEYE